MVKARTASITNVFERISRFDWEFHCARLGKEAKRTRYIISGTDTNDLCQYECYLDD